MAVEEINFQLNALFDGVESVLQNICGQKYFNDLKDFATRHPFVLTAIISISIFSALPLLFFVGFAVITLFISLICFLCIEGSLIAFGGLIFVGIVSFITVIVAAMISAMAVGFWMLQRIRIALCQVSCASRSFAENRREEHSPNEKSGTSSPEIGEIIPCC